MARRCCRPRRQVVWGAAWVGARYDGTALVPPEAV